MNSTWIYYRSRCVLTAILLLLPLTASGPDEIPYWLWRNYADYLAPIITKIFNNLIKQQKVPRQWKLGNVTLMLKVSPFSECSQLRPMSLTNIIMRTFERLAYKQEISTILQSSIGLNQFAYKKGHNTTMALLKCQQYWLNWLDKDADFVMVYSFDFSKAFDFVSYHISCNKLKLYDINPYVINWIINFLRNRKQRVAVDGVTTKFVEIDRGVPQGTVLGPLLFSIVVNDITVVNPETNLLIKFADYIT